MIHRTYERIIYFLRVEKDPISGNFIFRNRRYNGPALKVLSVSST